MNKIVLVLIGVFVLGVGLLFLSNQKQNIVPSEEKVSSEGKTIPGYSGKIIAGNTSPFLEFNKSDYEKALASDKIILLDFYANWCPICRAEEPEIYAGFDSLITDKLIGFRVNFNDSDTDSDEKQLAKDFNVPYQHTKIFLRNGQEVARSVDQWDRNRFTEEVEKIIKN